MASKFVYTYNDLYNSVNSTTHGKALALQTDSNNLVAAITRGVRMSYGNVDFRSSKRRSTISPGIYHEVFGYPLPADTKGMAICDIIRQINRKENWFLTDNVEFDRNKSRIKSMLTIDDRDGLRILRLATELTTYEVTINPCDSLTNDGTWAATGNAINLTTDTVNYINSPATLKFDTNGAAPVITNSNSPVIDLTSYYQQQIFVWVYIPSVTSAPTFTLKWGSDSSNYWSKAVTTTNEGLAFTAGWNLLRFDWPTSATGTPNVAAVQYLQFSGANCDTANSWRVNAIVGRIPDIHDILYYSKYAWQDASTNAYKENPTASGDYIVADTEEFDVIAARCSAIAAHELRNPDWKDLKKEADEAEAQYQVTRYLSERMLYQTTYEEFATLEGDYDTYNNNPAIRSKI